MPRNEALLGYIRELERQLQELSIRQAIEIIEEDDDEEIIEIGG